MVRSVKTPPERIVARDHLITAFNAEKMIRAGKFVVSLACAHLCYTRNQNTAVCPRCTEMLRRSVEDGREDWDGFRNGSVRDTMEWPADPCRQFNEKQ